MEKTAEEKLQQAEREFRERQMAEMEHRYERTIEELKQQHAQNIHDLKEQQKVAMELYNERRQELLHQNEGMLGAIGRLYNENQKLKEENSTLLAAAMDREQRLKQKEQEFQMRQELMERDARRIAKELEAELDEERTKNKTKAKKK